MSEEVAARTTRKPRLRFCPLSNDLLHPTIDNTRKKMMYSCRTCDYQEEAEESCVHYHEVKHTAREHTIILEDARADPTLPRAKDQPCPACTAREAVWRSESTPEGMTLYFQCTSCGHRWKDDV